MSIDEWSNAIVQELTYTYAPNISIEAKANRALMIDALTKSGFVNYPTEWWHWSYGDRYWAYHTGHSSAIYGGL
jgi:D-alanyl-D-alanine dipeptidase